MSLSRLPNSIEAFTPSVSCQAGAVLSRKIFLFSGGIGVIALLPTIKKISNHTFRVLLFSALGYLILLTGALQFFDFPLFIRVLVVLSITLCVTALLEHDTKFSEGLGAAAFAMLALLPFV